MNPNQAFKQKDTDLICVTDNGRTYYSIRCCECHEDRYVEACYWHISARLSCATGCVNPEWTRV